MNPHFTQHDNTERPFAVGSVFGLRSWLVGHDGHLLGCSYQEPWSDDENTAKCYVKSGVLQFGRNSGYWVRVSTQTGPHRQASKDCACGFYAFFDGSNDYSGISGHTITGIIEGYGLVTVGSRGFRAEKARIRALVAPDPGTAALYPSATVFATQAEALAAFPLTKPEDVGIETPEARLDRTVGQAFAHMHVSINGAVIQFGKAMTQAASSLSKLNGIVPAQDDLPENPVERRKVLAQRQADQRSAAGLRGVGGFDKRGHRR